ncbi:MAG: oxidoreductase [Parcubacteria group bacterium]|nr:oxidoreductase [Parcubacteria group bacterium]
MKMPFTLRDLFIPVAIIIAGIILAVAIYAVRIHHTITQGAGSPEAVRPVTPADHIIGNPGAPVTIIEYADIDSSYSKSFQLTMEQLMTEYANGGKVAWVYRHFPNTLQHASAATHALAAECATSLSLPTTFFRFIDAMQATAPGENEFNPDQYPVIVAELGIDQAAFKSCVTAGTFTKRVHDDYDNALAAGATGSPFVVLLVQGQKPASIDGALPYAAMKKLIDQSIAKVATST